MSRSLGSPRGSTSTVPLFLTENQNSIRLSNYVFCMQNLYDQNFFVEVGVCLRSRPGPLPWLPASHTC